MILIPGSSWSSAQALPTEAGPDLLNVTDPIGDPSLLVFDGKQSVILYQDAFCATHSYDAVHKYLDFDSSGTHAECVTVSFIYTGMISKIRHGSE